LLSIWEQTKHVLFDQKSNVQAYLGRIKAANSAIIMPNTLVLWTLTSKHRALKYEQLLPTTPEADTPQFLYLWLKGI
jgi:hypothetical protein